MPSGVICGVTSSRRFAFLKDTGVSFQADASGAVRVLLDGQARFEDGAANNTADDLVFKMGGAISAHNTADGVAFTLTFQRLG